MKKILAILLLLLPSVASATIFIVPSGGTGWGSIFSGALIYGNGQNALATTTQGTNGNVLALVSGIPAWVASTTFSSPLIYASGNVTCPTCNTSSLSGSGTQGQATYWTGTNSLGSVATGTVSGASVITATANRAVFGGALSISTSGGTFGAGNYVFPASLTVTDHATTTSTNAGGMGGIDITAVGSGNGTIGFNSFGGGYQAGVAGFGGLFQLQASTGDLTYFSESNVAAGAPHVHTTAFTVNSAGLFTANAGASTTVLTVSSVPATLLSTTVTGLLQSTTVSSPLSFSGTTLSCPTCTTNLSRDWQKETTYNTLSLTPTTTIALWEKANIFASSSMILDGSLGIATTSTTSAKLTVHTNTDVNNTYLRGSSNNNFVLRVENGGGQAKGLLVNGGNTTGSDASLFVVSSQDQTAPFFTVSDGNSFFQNGNVGIGDTIPTYPLDVTGEGHFTTWVDAMSFLATSSTATSTFMGSVTIGTTTGPTASTTIGLTVMTPNVVNGGDVIRLPTVTGFPDAAAISSFANTASSSFIGIGANYYITTAGASARYNPKTPGWMFIEGNKLGSDNMRWLYTNVAGTVSTYMQLDNTGNFGIGTTSPWGLLSVNPNGISGPAFVIGSSTATKFLVSNRGDVGIGTTSTAALTTNISGAASGLVVSGTVPGIVLEETDAVNGNVLIYANGSDGYLNNRAATGNLFFRTNDTEAMRIDSDQDVGVGSTSPFAKLAVTNAGANPSFTVEDAALDATPFTIDAAGLVGIQTLTPESNSTLTLNRASGLNVLGFTDNNTIKSYIGISSAADAPVTSMLAGDLGFRTTAGAMQFSTNNGTNASFTVGKSNTNVGIGSTTPSLVSISAAARGLGIAQTLPGIVLQDTDAGVGAELLIYNSGGDSFINSLLSTGDLRLYSAGTERVTIQASSNVGFNTTNDFAQIMASSTTDKNTMALTGTTNTHPVAEIKNGGGAGKALAVRGGTGTAPVFEVTNFASTTAIALFNADGKIYFNNLGTSGAGDSNAACYNTTTKQLTENAGVTTCLISALRFKDNIAALSQDKALKDILALRPVTFAYKGSGKITRGFIAEEVARVIPTAAGYNQKGEIQAYEPTEILSTLVKAFQGLVAQVSGLEAKMNTQQKIISDLQARMVKLEQSNN